MLVAIPVQQLVNVIQRELDHTSQAQANIHIAASTYGGATKHLGFVSTSLCYQLMHRERRTPTLRDQIPSNRGG